MDLQDANAAIRGIQRRTDPLVRNSPGLDLWQTIAVNMTDGASDKLQKHRSPHGRFAVLADKGVDVVRGNERDGPCFGWQSSKIQKAPRSMASAAAYSCADAVDMLVLDKVYSG